LYPAGPGLNKESGKMFDFLGGMFGSGGSAQPGESAGAEESNLTTGGISFGSGAANVGQSAFASQPLTTVTPAGGGGSSGGSGGSSSGGSSVGSYIGIAMMVLALL
jgi:hypothetical protein